MSLEAMINVHFQIYGWRPEFYKNPNELPEDMPQSLRNRIADLARSPNPTDRARVRS